MMELGLEAYGYKQVVRNSIRDRRVREWVEVGIRVKG
jgi:hypothetical protein